MCSWPLEVRGDSSRLEMRCIQASLCWARFSTLPSGDRGLRRDDTVSTSVVEARPVVFDGAPSCAGKRVCLLLGAGYVTLAKCEYAYLLQHPATGLRLLCHPEFRNTS